MERLKNIYIVTVEYPEYSRVVGFYGPDDSETIQSYEAIRCRSPNHGIQSHLDHEAYVRIRKCDCQEAVKFFCENCMEGPCPYLSTSTANMLLRAMSEELIRVAND